MRTELGTEGYIATEVLNYGDSDTSTYTFKADLWSLGCVLLYVLTNKLLLRRYRPYFRYTTGVVPFPRQELDENDICELGIQFITELMTPEPEKRLSASQALVHTWFVGGGSRSGGLDEELQRNIQCECESLWIALFIVFLLPKLTIDFTTCSTGAFPKRTRNAGIFAPPR